MTFAAGLAVGYGVLVLLPGDEPTGPAHPPGQGGQMQPGPDGEMPGEPRPELPPEIPVGELPPPGPDALPPLGEGVEEVPVDVPHFVEPAAGSDDGSGELRAHLVSAPGFWAARADEADGDLARRCSELARQAEEIDPDAPPVNRAARLLLDERQLLADLDAAGVPTGKRAAAFEALRGQ